MSSRRRRWLPNQGPVVGELLIGQDAGGGFPVYLAGPLVVGAVPLRRVGVAAAAGVSAAGHPVGQGAGQGEADFGEAGGDLGGDGRGAGLLGRGGRHAAIVAAEIPRLTHLVEYKCCMGTAEDAAYIACWRPSSVSPPAAAFARDVIAAVAPRRAGAGEEPAAGGREAGRLRRSGWAWRRFRRCCCTRRWPSGSPGARRGCPPVARRTLRTNLRFIGRRVVPQLYPADLPLPRERSKQPYSAAQIAGYPHAGRRPAHAGAADARRPGWSAWARAPG